MYEGTRKKIWMQSKMVFNNPKLRLKDILEWSASKESVKSHLESADVMIGLAGLGVWVAINRSHDKRK